MLDDNVKRDSLHAQCRADGNPESECRRSFYCVRNEELDIHIGRQNFFNTRNSMLKENNIFRELE